jgi:hypothetical protein
MYCPQEKLRYGFVALFACFVQAHSSLSQLHGLREMICETLCKSSAVCFETILRCLVGEIPGKQTIPFEMRIR